MLWIRSLFRINAASSAFCRCMVSDLRPRLTERCLCLSEHAGMRGSVGAAVANITTAYINDIPGTGVKKRALADLLLPATAFVNNSRGSNTRSTRTPDSKRTLMYQSTDALSQLLKWFLCVNSSYVLQINPSLPAVISTVESFLFIFKGRNKHVVVSVCMELYSKFQWTASS